MLFSILIPVYNAEKYIDNCIMSIISQTETDYEIVLVDDGSTDNSLAVCNKWANSYPQKIRVISKKNTGSLDTRRVCLYEARGDYFYFMDADDQLIDNNAFYELKKLIADTKCDMIVFNATIDLNKRKKLYKYPFSDKTVYEKENLSNIYRVLLSGTQLNTLWNKVFKRDLVDWDADYSNTTAIIKGTDFYQVLPIISNAKRILYLDQIFYYYNIQNGGGISHNFNAKLYLTSCLQHKRLVEFSKDWTIDFSEKTELLKERFMSDVAQMVLMIYYAKDLTNKEKVQFLSKVRNDEMYRSNHIYKNLVFKKKQALKFLDKEQYILLLAHINLWGLYRDFHEVLLKRIF